MRDFLGSRGTLVILLLSIMVLVVGVSVVTGSGSGSSDSNELGRVPSLVADPLMAGNAPHVKTRPITVTSDMPAGSAYRLQEPERPSPSNKRDCVP